MIRFHAYKGCDACRRARRWLEARGIVFAEIPIREQPPTASEVASMLRALGGRRPALCNTSGADYREERIGERLGDLSDDAFCALLAGNGNLVKRPFVIDEAAGIHLVGFREPDWEQAFGG